MPNPYYPALLSEKRPVSNASRWFITLGIAVLLFAIMCVFCSTVFSWISFTRIQQQSDIKPAEMAAGMSFALYPMRFVAPSSIVGLILIFVGIIRR